MSVANTGTPDVEQGVAKPTKGAKQRGGSASRQTTAVVSNNKSGCWCYNVFTDAYLNAQARADEKVRIRTGPQPWIQRKIAVGIVVALLGWSTYVFVGRIVVFSLVREEIALAEFREGVGLLFGFTFFWIMFIWSYLKIVSTPPGFARDYTPKVPPPTADVSSTQPPSRSLEPRLIARPEPLAFPYDSQRTIEQYDDDRNKDSDDEIVPKHSSTNEEVNEQGYTDENTVNECETKHVAPPLVTNISTTPTTTIKPRKLQRNSNQSHRTNITTDGTADDHGPGQDISEKINIQQQQMSGRPRSNRLKRPSGSISSSVSRGPATPTTTGPIISNNLPENAQPVATMSPPSPTAIPPPPLEHQTRTTSPPSPTPPILPKQIQEDNTRPSIPGSGVKRSGSGSGSHPHSQSHSRSQSQSQAHIRTQTPGTPTSPTSLTSVPSSNFTFPPQTQTRRTGSSRTPGDIHIREFLEEPPEPSYSRDGGREKLGLGQNYSLDLERNPRSHSFDLPPPLLSRRPQTQPVLDPEFRYCSVDRIIKPMRAHHCRACGTCVLYYDHHCPWIGQCVGARNRKFFVVFLIWSAFYELYFMVSVIPLLVRATRQEGIVDKIDGQVIAILIFAGVFFIFSIVLLATHVYLLSFNASTVEWYGFQRMAERETALLSSVFPLCSITTLSNKSRKVDPYQAYREEYVASREGRPRTGVRARRDLLKQWDKEWGRIGKEGNLWWLGGKRANWESVMGKSVIGWLLPIGDTSKMGLDYPLNPRFDDMGRWRRRKEWPKELQ